MKYALILPAALLCTLFTLWPLVELGIISLYRTNFITSRFVGIDNYVSAFRDADFIRSMVNSAGYIVLLVSLTIAGALTITMLCMRESKRWHDVTRVLIYLPTLSAGIIIAQVWRWVFHVNGPVNFALGSRIHWFGGPQAVFAISLIVAFSTLGAVTVVFLSAVLSIDKDLYDAAMIDGASWPRIKRSIVLPHIMPTVLIMAMVAAIAAPQIFETVYALAPTPYGSTMGFQIYAEAFVYGNHGRAAAMSVVLLVAMFGLAIGKQRLAE